MAVARKPCMRQASCGPLSEQAGPANVDQLLLLGPAKCCLLQPIAPTRFALCMTSMLAQVIFGI